MRNFSNKQWVGVALCSVAALGIVFTVAFTLANTAPILLFWALGIAGAVLLLLGDDPYHQHEENSAWDYPRNPVPPAEEKPAGRTEASQR